MPTSSMSGVRKHFWQVVRRSAGGGSCRVKYGLSGCMPALMSSVEGSLRGISGADGLRRWSRASKKRWYRSRISSEVTQAVYGRAAHAPSAARASPASTAVTDMNAQPEANASTASAGDGVPTIATHVASPSAAPIWRNIVCTPIPVESWSGRSVAAAVAVKDGSISPTPVPVRICPGRIAVR